MIKILFDINRALLLGYQNKCKLIFDVVGAEQETYVVPYLEKVQRITIIDMTVIKLLLSIFHAIFSSTFP